MPHCRSCKAYIIFAETVNGKKMPLDARPVEDGNIHVHSGLASVLIGTALDNARAKKIDLYRSHFASCPSARKHRKKEKTS